MTADDSDVMPGTVEKIAGVLAALRQIATMAHSCLEDFLAVFFLCKVPGIHSHFKVKKRHFKTKKQTFVFDRASKHG